MSKVIVIEDDKDIREELSNFLKRNGYSVAAPVDFENIINSILNENGDILLLDINLPIYDGHYICREIRKKSDIPIIVVTSRDSEVDELISINLGADDYITKPYNTQILLARISAILKRVNSSVNSSNLITYNDLTLNLLNASITYKNNSLELTKNEMKILSHLINNRGNIVSRESLMEYLWKSDFFVDDSTLSVNITRLRKKLEKIGLENVIETRRGLGYIIQ